MKIYQVLYLMLAFMACQTKKNANEEETNKPLTAIDSVALLEKNVLAVHDSVMPLMSELMRLKKEVSTKLAESADPTIKEAGLDVSTQLEKADRGMMEWMNQYNGDTLPKLEPNKAMEYLKGQQVKVNEMSRMMRKSIADAKTYLH